VFSAPLLREGGMGHRQPVPGRSRMAAKYDLPLPYNSDMINKLRLPRRRHTGRRPSWELVVALAVVAVGASGFERIGSIAAAQASGPCALLTTDDVKPLASNASVADGVATWLRDGGFGACRYMWGDGLWRFNLDATVGDASRMFSGVRPDLIKQRLLTSVRAGTADSVIPDLGEAAVFVADSPVYVHAMTYLKGRVLVLHLDGLDARDKKDQLIALLKSVASRL